MSLKEAKLKEACMAFDLILIFVALIPLLLTRPIRPAAGRPPCVGHLEEELTRRRLPRKQRQ